MQCNMSYRLKSQDKQFTTAAPEDFNLTILLAKAVILVMKKRTTDLNLSFNQIVAWSRYLFMIKR